MRHILDPQSVPRVQLAPPTAVVELPISTRKFGYIPDLSAIRPGDVILTSPVTPNLVATSIQNYQIKGGLYDEEAAWTHVAVYIGDGLIVEATPNEGVHVDTIYRFVPTHKILVRSPQDVSDSTRYKIAIKAMARIQQPYSVSKLWKLRKVALRGLWRPWAELSPDNLVICSKLYSDAYLQATESLLCSGRADAWPGHISASTKLVDVKVLWSPIKNGEK